MILIIFAALTPFIFIPGLQDPSGLPKTLYISGLAVAAVVLLLRRERLQCVPLSLVVFIAAILFSAFWAINPHLYLSQLSLDLSGIALFLYTANCLQSKELPRAVMIFCGMGVLIVVSVFVGIQIDPRVSGPGWSVVNEKYYTLLLAGLIPLAMGLWSIGRYWTVFGTMSVVWMLAYIFWIPSRAVNVVFLILSVSALSFIVWKLFKDYLLISASVSIFVFIVSFFAFIFYGPETLETFQIQERISWLEESQTMLVESNFLGIGRGQWQTQPHKRSPIHGAARHGWRPGHAHNDIMEILAETGILGFGAFLAFLYATLRLPTGQIGYWLKLSLLAFIFEGMFWSLLHLALFVPFIWMIAGMIWADRKKEQGKSEDYGWIQLFGKHYGVAEKKDYPFSGAGY